MERNSQFYVFQWKLTVELVKQTLKCSVTFWTEMTFNLILFWQLFTIEFSNNTKKKNTQQIATSEHMKWKGKAKDDDVDERSPISTLLFKAKVTENNFHRLSWLIDSKFYFLVPSQINIVVRLHFTLYCCQVICI